MANVRIRDLPAAASANLTDIFEKTNDPGGAPVSQKVTLAQIQSAIGGTQTTVLSASWVSASVTINSALAATQSLYATASVTSVYATQSLFATQSLYATQSLNATSSATASYISSSATWDKQIYLLTASFSQTASFVTASNVVGTVSSASFATTCSFYSYVYYNVTQSSAFITNSLFASQSLYATQSLFATQSINAYSASWVSASAFITTAQTASYVTASNVIGTIASASYSFSSSYTATASIALNATVPVSVPSASWVSASAFITTAQTASYVTSSNIVGIITSLSASWASSSLSASYLTAGQYNITGLTASLFGTASYATNAGTAYAINFIPVTATSASWVSASVTINSASYANTSSWTLNYTLPSQINVTGITASFTGSLTGTASFSNTSSYLVLYDAGLSAWVKLTSYNGILSITSSS